MIHNDYSVAKKIKAFSFTRKKISRLKGKEYGNDELPWVLFLMILKK